MIITLLTKELKQQAISLSNYMVFAVTLGIILFLFFNTFYGVNVSSLDGMFGLFPWLFALVVPAFTMASVAGERQNKTLEFLFAHPISELQMIIVKV
ncbi:gliding motility-associated ABC transporter substrate-binding protein GldG, partial [candidate division WWE3 bacterium CG_4_9_14_3_um_filter_41_6]